MSTDFDIAISDTSDLLTFNAIQRQDDIKNQKKKLFAGSPSVTLDICFDEVDSVHTRNVSLPLWHQKLHRVFSYL